MTTVDELAAVAEEAARAPGSYLRAAFDRSETDGEYADTDVTATADAEAERRVLPVIRGAFPDHAVSAAESGDRGGSAPYRWVVDPLDGTDDFTAGLPTFATAVTVLESGTPAAAAVHLPVLEDTYVARRDGGVTYCGEPTVATTDLPTEKATVGFVIGHDVKADPERLVTSGHLKNTLEVRTKRVIESWSPAVHWALLTRGLVQGMVAYHPDEEEQFAGELLARESGAGIRDGGDVFVAAAGDRILAELADITEPVA
jgi:myo-inositol-1(or 4)-monophosphatase